MTVDRFRDDGRSLSDYLMLVLVECPRCSASAEVKPPPDAAKPTWSSPRRLVCGGCGFTDEATGKKMLLGVPVDPYFRLPLALRSDALGHVIWAYNREHLAQLRWFVEATLRERNGRPGPGTMIERLPAWFGLAKHRRDLSRALAGMAAVDE